MSLTPRPGLHQVFNLEVDVDHVYFVGQSGILVHNTYVYEGLRKGKRYIGITDDIERRASEHARIGRRVDGIDGLDNLSRSDARAVEQVLIEKFGLSSLENKINSIARSNPIYNGAIQRGREILGDLDLFGF